MEILITPISLRRIVDFSKLNFTLVSWRMSFGRVIVDLPYEIVYW